jgi:ADP-ribose pyrophosphatase YjhB (NUDIX family)
MAWIIGVLKRKERVNDMVTTCGAYIIYNELILIVHSTGQPMNVWGIPKGLIDGVETPEDTMYREVFEETNIVLADYRHKLIDLGTVKYKHKHKTLHGFIVILDEWDYADVYCSSTYSTKEGIIRPEVDAFVWLPVEAGISYLHYTQKRLFNENKKKFEKFLT